MATATKWTRSEAEREIRNLRSLANSRHGTQPVAGERRMESRFAGDCAVCRGAFPSGAPIYWARETGARHIHCAPVAAPAASPTGHGCAICGVTGAPLMNSSVHGAVCADCYDRAEREA